MKKTLKNFQVSNIVGALSSDDVKELINKRLPVKFAWSLRLNLNTLGELNKTLEEAVDEIKKDYADDEHSEVSKDDENIRNIKPEYISEYSHRLNELMGQDNEVEIRMAKIEDLESIKEISLAEMTALEFMIEEAE